MKEILEAVLVTGIYFEKRKMADHHVFANVWGRVVAALLVGCVF